MEDFERSTVSRRDRIVAAATMLAALVPLLAVASHAGLPLGRAAAITPVLFAPSALATGITAFLFWRQAALLRSLPLLVLACGYGYATLVIAVYLAALPDIVSPGSPALAPRESIAWLFFAAELGFGGSLSCYAVLRFFRLELAPQLSYARVSAVICGLVPLTAALSAAAAYGLGPWLPLIDADGNRTALYGPAFLAIAVPAGLGVVLLWWRSGRSSLVDLWISVVLFLTGVDVVLTLLAQTRWTLGWYVERLTHFTLAIAMLLILVSHVDLVLRRNAKLTAELAEQAIHDALTGLPNRRGFDQRLAEALQWCARSKEPLAVALIDIDHFKLFNDTYGHQAGDVCLQRVAGRLADETGRAMDTVARYGGEEFGVILPGATVAGARTVASRMRAGVEELDMRPGRGATHSRVTISVGICVARRPEDLDMHSLLVRADGALYAAKAAGRNRVVDADFPETALA